MIERDTCYFCTSPFQLYAIIALAVERKETADLYIDPQFSEAEEFAERIRTLNIFNTVKVIESNGIYKKYMTSGPGLINHLQIANSYLHVKDIAESIISSDLRYHNMFVSSKAYIPRMIQLYFIKEKWNFNLYYFDDGAGSYSDDRAYKIKKTDKLLRWLLFGHKSTDMQHKRYVFSPELYRRLNQDKDVEKITRIWDSDDGKEIMNKVFGCTDIVDIPEKVIILDQPRAELFDEMGNAEINDIYENLANKIGKENVVLKKHPRSKMSSIGNIKYIENMGIPFEVYCMNMNLNNKIIVTYSSTAASTPKILFNQEPEVIVLSKIIPTIQGEKNMFESFFLCVRDSYSNKNRLYLPESISDLEQIVCNIK